MKERPIIFNGEMVRAILDGKKTQTRRVIKLLPKSNEKIYTKCCPYGKPGDRLWVRETWAYEQWEESTTEYVTKEMALDAGNANLEGWAIEGPPIQREKIFYRATDKYNGKWKPSIFMPRWASRITLEIRDIRIERIQDITPADALAEGIEYERHGKGLGDACDEIRILQVFQKLWDEINEKRGFGWNENPWVFVISFKKVD